MPVLQDLSWFDYLAVAAFVAAWVGYSWYVDRSRASRRSITAVMSRYRLAWAQEMGRRDVRIVDTQVVGNFLTGIGFFASTTILVIGGLFALLGSADQALAALSDLPLMQPHSVALWEAKVLLLMAVFVYAFFKFAWAFRLSSYASILIGAMPMPGAPPEDLDRHAKRIARMVQLVAHHQNHGFRAYFFAVALITWFIHPGLLIASSAVVLAVLYRREFRSRAYRALTEP